MFIDKLKVSPKSRSLIVIFIGGFLIFILINILVFQPLGQIVQGKGILDFEFAWVPEQVKVIFATWGEEGMILQTIGVFWDYLYIVGYVSFLFGGILLVARELSGKWQKIGLYVGIISILAGLFDAIENIFLLTMLYAPNPNNIISIIPATTGIMATLKFGGIFIALIYFVPGLIAVVIKMFKNRTV
jgi:hypothetical protein